MPNNKQNLNTRTNESGSQQGSQQDGFAGNQFEDQLDRFKEVFGIGRGGRTDTKLAKIIGLTQQAIAGWRNKGAIPPKWITKICEDKGIMMEWLLFGKGSMYSSEPIIKETAPQYKDSPKIPESPDLDPHGFELIPVVEAHLSAGCGAYIGKEPSVEFYAFRTDWLKRIASSLRKVILVPVRGPSMENTIQDGDMVLVDTGRTKIYPMCIYAIGIGEIIAIKRLESLPDGRIRTISDNKKYPPEEIPAQDIRILGQVIWLARELIKRGIQ